MLKNLKRKLLFYFTALSMVTLIAIGVIGFRYMRGYIIEDAKQSLYDSALHFSELIEKDTEITFTFLEGLAKQNQWLGHEHALIPQLDKLRKELLTRENFLRIGIADPEGRLFILSKDHDRVQIVNIAERTYFKEAMLGKRSIMNPTPTINPEYPDEIVVVFAVPIYHEDTIRGVLVATAKSNYFSTLSAHMGYGENGIAFITDMDGVAVAHPLQDLVDIQANLITLATFDTDFKELADIIEEARTLENNVTDYAIGDLKLYIAYSRVKGTNWTLYVTAEKNEVLRLLSPLSWSLAIYNSVIFAFGLFVYMKINKEIDFQSVALTLERRVLEQQAMYDDLTNVYNRRTGISLLKDRLELARREQVCISVIYIDIDDLKITNDTLGHHLGDQLILDIVAVINSVIRKTDFITRVGGDELFITLHDCNHADAERVMALIEEKMKKYNSKPDKRYVLACSYGIATSDDVESPFPEELINHADSRMYLHKQAKKSTPT